MYLTKEQKDRVVAMAMNFRDDADKTRNWLPLGHADSYGSEDNRVEAWVLEGSPPHGWLLYQAGDAFRLNSEGVLIAEFYWSDGRECAVRRVPA
jgi:hypothetical protein